MTSTIPSADICGIQFGLVTASDVDKWAVAELNAISTKKNAPIFNTVNCPSQGPANANSLCVTCGADIEHCQGHITKFSLYQPVNNVNFFPVLLKVLPCICTRCFRFLAPDSYIRRLKAGKVAGNSSYKK